MTPIPENSVVSIGGTPVNSAHFKADEYRAIYTAIAQCWDRERTAISHNIGWGLVISAALLATEVGIAGHIISAIKANELGPAHSVAAALLVAMSMFGGFCAWNLHFSIRISSRQLVYLKYFYVRTTVDKNGLFEGFLGFPRPFPEIRTLWRDVGYQAIGPALIALWAVLTTLEIFAAVLLLTPLEHAMAKILLSWWRL